MRPSRMVNSKSKDHQPCVLEISAPPASLMLALSAAAKASSPLNQSTILARRSRCNTIEKSSASSARMVLTLLNSMRQDPTSLAKASKRSISETSTSSASGVITNRSFCSRFSLRRGSALPVSAAQAGGERSNFTVNSIDSVSNSFRLWVSW